MSSNEPPRKPAPPAKHAATRPRSFARRIECSPDGDRDGEPILPVTRKAARQPCDGSAGGGEREQ